VVNTLYYLIYITGYRYLFVQRARLEQGCVGHYRSKSQVQVGWGQPRASSAHSHMHAVFARHVWAAVAIQRCCTCDCSWCGCCCTPLCGGASSGATLDQSVSGSEVGQVVGQPAGADVGWRSSSLSQNEWLLGTAQRGFLIYDW